MGHGVRTEPIPRTWFPPETHPTIAKACGRRFRHNLMNRKRNSMETMFMNFFFLIKNVQHFIIYVLTYVRSQMLRGCCFDRPEIQLSHNLWIGLDYEQRRCYKRSLMGKISFNRRAKTFIRISSGFPTRIVGNILIAKHL